MAVVIIVKYCSLVEERHASFKLKKKKHLKRHTEYKKKLPLLMSPSKSLALEEEEDSAGAGVFRIIRIIKASF